MLTDPYRRFLILAGMVFAALVATSIAFCVYVDPYRMYGTDRIPNKPQIYAQAALAKAYMLERVRPDTLILGNDGKTVLCLLVDFEDDCLGSWSVGAVDGERISLEIREGDKPSRPLEIVFDGEDDFVWIQTNREPRQFHRTP